MLKFFRIPFALSGDKAAIPDTVDAVAGSVSYPEGFGFNYQRDFATDPLALNIPRDKSNQLYYDITAALAELQSQGVPDFITSALNGGTAYSYTQNAIVKYSGDLYLSLVAANTALPSDATKWALLPTPARVRDGYNTVAAVAGTADAITLSLTPAQTAFTPGPTWWRATAANVTATPTVKRDGLAAKTLVKGNNRPLVAGDIPGAGAWMMSQYDATLDREVLLNPATGAATVTAVSDPTFVDNSGKPASTGWAKFGFAVLIAATGYLKFPNWMGGLILQWGNVGPTNASGNVTVTFPLTFPNLMLQAVATSIAGAVGVPPANIGASYSTTTLQVWVNTATSGVGIRWFAIGY